MVRRWRSILVTRRGEFFYVPLVGAEPTSVLWVSPLLTSRRIRPATWRRGQLLVIVAGVSAPLAPAFVPVMVRSTRRLAPGLRRGALFFAPPSVPQVSVPYLRRARRATPGVLRRGDVYSAPLTQVLPLRLPLLRAFARQAIAIRRRSFLSVPLTGAAPATSQPPPPALVQQVSVRRFPGARRRSLLQVPLVGVAPSAPTLVPSIIDGRRPVSPGPRRRASFGRVVATIGQPQPLIAATRRRMRPSGRRGRFLFIPPLQLAQPAWVPGMLVGRRRHPVARPRGRFLAFTAAVSGWVPTLIRTRRRVLASRPSRRIFGPPWVGLDAIPDRNATSRALVIAGRISTVGVGALTSTALVTATESSTAAVTDG